MSLLKYSFGDGQPKCGDLAVLPSDPMVPFYLFLYKRYPNEQLYIYYTSA